MQELLPAVIIFVIGLIMAMPIIKAIIYKKRHTDKKGWNMCDTCGKAEPTMYWENVGMFKTIWHCDEHAGFNDNYECVQYRYFERNGFGVIQKYDKNKRGKWKWSDFAISNKPALQLKFYNEEYAPLNDDNISEYLRKS